MLIPVNVAQGESVSQVSSEVTLTIIEPSTSRSDVVKSKGQVITMEVIAEGTETMAGVQFKLKFDSSVVQVPRGGVVAGDFPHQIMALNSDNDREFVAALFASTIAPGNAFYTIAEITFIVVGEPGQTSPLQFYDVKAANVEVNPIDIISISGSITVDDSSSSSAGKTEVDTPKPQDVSVQGPSEAIGADRPEPPDPDVIVVNVEDNLSVSEVGNESTVGNESATAQDEGDSVPSTFQWGLIILAGVLATVFVWRMARFARRRRT